MTVADLLLPGVKSALNKTTADDNAELLDLLGQAVAEYAERVRPLPGTQVVTVRAGGWPVILPSGTAAVTHVDGVAVVGDLDFDVAAGLLYADGVVLSGYYPRLSLTVTIGDLPKNHLGTIVADVAEYWTRTQRASGGARPSFGGDGFEPEQGRPLVMWPRIRALAGVTIA